MIGAATCGRALAAGHSVVAVVRPGSRLHPPGVQRVVEADLAREAPASFWAASLEGTDAVINCAGVLQSGAGQAPEGVHHRGIASLYAACRAHGVPRVVHLSAIGVDRGPLSGFSRTKLAGDEALMALDLDWVILRPSVVLGPGATGASALVRGLAALPVLPVMPGTGPLQVVQLDEVVDTILAFADRGAPARIVLELAGPERLEFADVVAEYRRWLGRPPARRVRLPRWLAALLFRLGDLAGRLGWRPALRSNAAREMARGATGDPAEWRRLTGIEPRTLAASLAARPPTLQERWFARLFWLQPVALVVLAFFWIGTGLVSLGPGFEIGTQLLRMAGLPALAAPGVAAGALADIVIGAGILYRPWARRALWGAVLLSLFYMTTGTLLMPSLWRDPLGPMMKIWPILALNLVALAMLDER
jgi:uncharacterized protein YbjT (DUF2867 family)